MGTRWVTSWSSGGLSSLQGVHKNWRQVLLAEMRHYSCYVAWVHGDLHLDALSLIGNAFNLDSLCVLQWHEYWLLPATNIK